MTLNIVRRNSTPQPPERKQILDDLAKAEERDGLYDRTPQPPSPEPQRWPTDVTSPGPTQLPGQSPTAPEQPVSAGPIDGEHVRMTFEAFASLLEQDKALRHESAALQADRDSWRRVAEKLEGEIAALKEENERKCEALSQIKLTAGLMDGKCKWDHAKTFNEIVSMANIGMK